MPTTIMIADDAKIVRRLVRGALRRFEDTDILEANDSTEALKIAREYRGPIHLLLSDVVLPGRISGIEMAGILCHTRPETKVLLMSGYAPDPLTIKSAWGLVQKPFTALEIRERVRAILTEKL